jgi:hypothetical protein
MQRSSWFLHLGCLLTFTTASLSRASAVQPPKEARQIEVVVEDFKTHQRLSGARVFVLSGEGRQLAEAWADELGVALLPNVPKEANPKYLLAERDWFFLVGRKWLPGQMEYLMPLLPLTPPGLS